MQHLNKKKIMKGVIENLKLSIEMSGDGGIKAFTDEEENDMYIKN